MTLKPQPRRGSRKRGPYANHAERRRRIIDAAIEVFSGSGYQAGSLQDVADVVGMSQTGLLHYFPTKRDLLVAVLDHRDERDRPLPTETERGFPAGIVERARSNEAVPTLIELYTVLCGESITDDHPARGYFAGRFGRLREEFAGQLEQLQAAGRLRKGVDVGRAAASIVALWDGIQTQWLLDRSIDVPACLADYLDLIISPAIEPGM